MLFLIASSKYLNGSSTDVAAAAVQHEEVVAVEIPEVEIPEAIGFAPYFESNPFGRCGRDRTGTKPPIGPCSRSGCFFCRTMINNCNQNTINSSIPNFDALENEQKGELLVFGERNGMSKREVNDMTTEELCVLFSLAERNMHVKKIILRPPNRINTKENYPRQVEVSGLASLLGTFPVHKATRKVDIKGLGVFQLDPGQISIGLLKDGRMCQLTCGSEAIMPTDILERLETGEEDVRLNFVAKLETPGEKCARLILSLKGFLDQPVVVVRGAEEICRRGIIIQIKEVLTELYLLEKDESVRQMYSLIDYLEEYNIKAYLKNRKNAIPEMQGWIDAYLPLVESKDLSLLGHVLDFLRSARQADFPYCVTKTTRSEFGAESVICSIALALDGFTDKNPS